MPWLLALGGFLARLVATQIGYWVVSAFLFLGIKLVTDHFVAAPLLDSIQHALEGAGGDVIGWVRYFNVDRYITGILSAYAAAAAASRLRLKKG